MRILSKKFFNRPVLAVAQQLLGKFLIRTIGGKKITVMITEVEAYDGPCDKASHASRGCTERNKTMWGEAGKFYVYFTYGMHWMLNVVTGPKGYPAAVLLRSGKLQMANDKWIDMVGPGRLTKYLKIDKRLNDRPANKKTGLWLEDRGIRISAKGGSASGGKKSQIIAGPRVGVDYAGEWAKKKYNFKLKNQF